MLGVRIASWMRDVGALDRWQVYEPGECWEGQDLVKDDFERLQDPRWRY